MPTHVRDFVDFKERSNLSTKLGTETDSFPNEVCRIRGFIQKYPFECVMGSVHVIGNWIFDEPSEIDEFSKRDTWRVYEEYFSLVRSAASSCLFDVLGRLDLIKIFGARPKGDFSRTLVETAEALAESNMCMEINTRGLRRPCQGIYPSEQFLRILCRLNVPVAFGSETHVPEDVGRNFKEATKLAKRVGYTHSCTFSLQERTFVRM